MRWTIREMFKLYGRDGNSRVVNVLKKKKKKRLQNLDGENDTVRRFETKTVRYKRDVNG